MPDTTKDKRRVNNSSRWEKKSRRRFLRQALGAGAAFAASRFLPRTALAQETRAQFANPGQLQSSGGKLNIVLESSSEFQRSIPNVSDAAHLRYFQGWFPATTPSKVPAVSAGSAAGPGPTLRAQVGDHVQIAFFNRVNDKKFKYTTVTAEGSGQKGCDLGVAGLYPGADTYPNCFHGSSTANIHFHGTHVSPDGLGDNVLVQVMPDAALNEKQMLSWFQEVFATCPTAWEKMPLRYRKYQEAKVKAAGNGMWAENEKLIKAGLWPEYLSGGFPNCYTLPRVGTPNPYTQQPYMAGQAPGTHWYHAHKHGSTALHMMNGLAGAFVIEDNTSGGYDAFLKGIYGQDASGNYLPGFENVMVFQNISTQQNQEIQGAPANIRNGSNNIMVNGQFQPVITMRPGQVQLWRLVNATVGRLFGGVIAGIFSSPGFNFAQTAMDGVQLSPDNFINQPFLSGYLNGVQYPSVYKIANGLALFGGNRADVLVQAPPTAQNGLIQFPATGTPLFYISVAGTPVTGQSLPTTWLPMPPFLANLPAPTGSPHPVVFGWGDQPGRNAGAAGGRVNNLSTTPPQLNLAPHFEIDHKQFSETKVDQCVPLNALQDWELSNESTIPHPFHIHINPFQVMEISVPAANGTYTTYTPAAKTDPVWQDVVAIPAGAYNPATNTVTPGKVRIRTRFVDFTGTYVLHCHILAHEDRGMMQLVRVLDPTKYPGGCQVNIPHHH